MKIRYFDHAATTPVRDEVLKEMVPYFNIYYGNASALYSAGKKAKKGLEEARICVANAIGCNNHHEIYFTSCGSESDNLALKGVAYANRYKGNHIITSAIEHPAVLNTCKTLERQGFRVTYLNVDKNGFVDINQLVNSICNDTILISIMFANNEIGTIQPIEQIGNIARQHNILFHTDAVQAIGNLKVDVKRLNIDLLSISGHKFYAPKGVGALYVRDGVEFEKIQDGGHQEKDKRAGTENVAEIVGLGKAINLAYQQFDEHNKYLTKLRDLYISKIETTFLNAKLNGDKERRLPGNANFSFPGNDSGKILLQLDEVGICVSAGSACSTGNIKPSHVLTAIGLAPQLASSAIRVSFGYDNTEDDVMYLIKKLQEIIKN